MTIVYLFRSPGTGHSLEALFENIQREMNHYPAVTATCVYLPHVSRGLWSIWKNWQFVRRLRADVFHITGDVHYAALALPAAKTVLTIHDCITLQRNRKRPFRFVLFWLLWFYLPVRRAAMVTAVSEKTRQELIRYVGKIARKTVVVPNGYVPAFTYRPAPANSTPVLLQIGTAPHKNVHRLLMALEGIRCTLLIVGPLSTALTQALEQYRIMYKHYSDLSQPEIVALYEACDLVTFVSTYEGFGMPIIEANAVGRPIITSDIAPMCKLAHAAASLVDPTDVTAIRQSILRILNDEQYRQNRVEQGLVNAKRYTLQTTVNGYYALYRAMDQ